MTLEEWEQDKDRELDEQLTALFQSTRPPEPPAGFVSRTMRAVLRAPLPEGRQPLRLPWIVPVGWATLVATVAAVCYGALGNQRIIAEMLSSLVALGVRGGMRAVQSVHTGSMVFDVLATTSHAVSRAIATPQATAGLMLMAVVAATSLSALKKLLFSEKESSSW